MAKRKTSKKGGSIEQGVFRTLYPTDQYCICIQSNAKTHQASVMTASTLETMCNATAKIVISDKRRANTLVSLGFPLVPPVIDLTIADSWAMLRQHISNTGGLLHGDIIQQNSDTSIICFLNVKLDEAYLIRYRPQEETLVLGRNCIILKTGDIIRHDASDWTRSFVVRILKEGEVLASDPEFLKEPSAHIDEGYTPTRTRGVIDKPRLVFERILSELEPSQSSQALIIPPMTNVENIASYFPLHPDAPIQYTLNDDNVLIQKVIPFEHLQSSLFTRFYIGLNNNKEEDDSLVNEVDSDDQDIMDDQIRPFCLYGVTSIENYRLRIPLSYEEIYTIYTDPRLHIDEIIDTVRAKRAFSKPLDAWERAYSMATRICSALSAQKRGGRRLRASHVRKR